MDYTVCFGIRGSNFVSSMDGFREDSMGVVSAITRSGQAWVLD
jgi:hypothetical protein